MKGVRQTADAIRAGHAWVLSAPTRRWAVAVFLLSLLLALAFAFLLFPRLIGDTSGLDPDQFGEAGRTLYETGRFDDVTRAPLYPTFIAGVSWAFRGYALRNVQVAQALLAALTCVVMYAMFREVLDAGAAKYASLACAVSPMALWYVPRLWTETLLTLMLALFSLSLVRAMRRPTVARMCLCGLAAGALALSKGIGLVFVFIAPVLLLARFRRDGLRWGALFLLCAALLIVPWTYRNLRRAGQLLPIHTNGGITLYLGNGFTRHWLESPLSYVDLMAMTIDDITENIGTQEVLLRDQVEHDNILRRAALAEYGADPLLLPRKILTQSITFWYLSATPSRSVAIGLVQLPAVILGIAGAVLAFRRRSWALALLVPVLGIMGVGVVLLAFARLSATVTPYMLALAVYALAATRASPQVEDPGGAQRDGRGGLDSRPSSA